MRRAQKALFKKLNSTGCTMKWRYGILKHTSHTRGGEYNYYTIGEVYYDRGINEKPMFTSDDKWTPYVEGEEGQTEQEVLEEFKKMFTRILTDIEENGIVVVSQLNGAKEL